MTEKTNGSLELRKKIRAQLLAEEERARREAAADAEMLGHVNMGRKAFEAHLETITGGNSKKRQR